MIAGDQQGRSLTLMTIGSGDWRRGALFYNESLGLRASLETFIIWDLSIFFFIYIKNQHINPLGANGNVL